MRLFLVLLGLGGALLPGCDSPQPTGQPPAMSPRQHTMLPNVPVPIGFRIVPERSVARESGRLRVAQVEFEGRGQPDDVADFYTQYMPAAKFQLKQRRFDVGDYLMRFESDAEECNVRVKPRGQLVTIVIDLGPLGAATTAADQSVPAVREARPARRPPPPPLDEDKPRPAPVSPP